MEFLENLDLLSMDKLKYAPEVTVTMSNGIYVGKVL